MLNEERLQHLLKVVGKQAQLLQLSWERLFNEYFLDENWVLSLTQNMEAAERLETFLARFNRMQDTLGDKLLPELLKLLEEHPGPAIDNYRLAERYGWLESAEVWVEIRHLRNQLVHEYLEDAQLFLTAIERARRFTPQLLQCQQRMQTEIKQRINAK